MTKLIGSLDIPLYYYPYEEHKFHSGKIKMPVTINFTEKYVTAWDYESLRIDWGKDFSNPDNYAGGEKIPARFNITDQLPYVDCRRDNSNNNKIVLQWVGKYIPHLKDSEHFVISYWPDEPTFFVCFNFRVYKHTKYVDGFDYVGLLANLNNMPSFYNFVNFYLQMGNHK